MSGVDVLAAIDGLLDLVRHRVAMKRRDFDRQVAAGKEPHHTVTIKADRAEYLQEMGKEARAAVAELIEADIAYDEARAEYEAKAPSGTGEIDSRTEADFASLEAEIARRAAALARCRGGDA